MNVAEAKALVKQLKRGSRGWSMTLPDTAGTCLDKRIDILCTSYLLKGVEPPLSDPEIELLTHIITNLPRLAARAEKAWEDYGGNGQLDESDRLSRPQIVIDRTKEPGRWAMIIEIAKSDYGWHVEFSGTRFKEIWAGD